MINSMTYPLCEQKIAVKDPSGYQMDMDKISFNEIDLKWASYVNPLEKVLTFTPDKTTVVSHFRLQDASAEMKGKGRQFSEKQFVVYREAAGAYDLQVSATQKHTRSFFELIMSAEFFDQLFTEESRFFRSFQDSINIQTPSFDFIAGIVPSMYAIINDMKNSPYSGYLKGIYLEAKSVELFLMQVQQLDQHTSARQTRLKPTDIERLHAVKEYIHACFDQPCSITGLARMAGINQMKLKDGFKELFGTTVFGYINDIRMQEARRLLLDEKLFVSEVADRIGYKHPQHFTAAFRRKYGIAPKELKL